MHPSEFGLPISPDVGVRAGLVRERAPLEPFVCALTSRFGPGFESACSVQELSAALRGWDWAPAAPSCPVGGLWYAGTGPLPPRATVDPAAATTAVPAPPVVPDALPAWQRRAWLARPLNAPLFERLAAADGDRDFLLGVVRNGVLLVRDLDAVRPFSLPNYASALAAREHVSCVVRDEVAQGWVLPVAAPPRFVHPVGAVPKSDGGVRVIHDHSVPVGAGVNEHEVYVRYTWDSLDLALRYLVPHVFMARLDISSYYRHFMVHPSHWELQGFEWDGSWFVDSRVQFGLRLAPELAHRFTMFIKRVLHANGLRAVVGVMDDYLLLHADRDACMAMLAAASALLSDLGFSVNFKPGKTVPPARVQKFVGVVVNSARFSLSLPSDKLQGLLADIRAALARRTVPRKALQSVVGKMQWASRVVFGGRVFMRACVDGLSSVLHPGHHVSLSGAMRADLHWWLQNAAMQNGAVSLRPGLPTFFVYTDACLSPVPSVGVFCAGAFVSLRGAALGALGLPVPPAGESINVWECFAVWVALRLFSGWWRGARVQVFCDNAATVAWLGGGAPRPPAARAVVQGVFSVCVCDHIRLSVQHIAGEQNVLADTLSRRQWALFGPQCASSLGTDSPFLTRVLPALQA